MLCHMSSAKKETKQISWRKAFESRDQTTVTGVDMGIQEESATKKTKGDYEIVCQTRQSEGVSGIAWEDNTLLVAG